MARFRLRYRSTDLEMPPGDFVIGRSSTCNLALDDGLVSRRHALLRVTENEVVVEDLGSRNGVSVNGTKIEAPTTVGHLDRVTIGSQEMVILSQSKLTAAQTLQIERCPNCGALNEPTAEKCVQCGSVLKGGGPETMASKVTLQSIPQVLPDLSEPADEPTRTATTFELIATIADKSLHFGRYEESARILEPTLNRLREHVASGGKIDAQDVAQGTRFALRLAEGPNPAKWLKWVFDIYTSLERLMPAEVIDRLHELVRKKRYNDLKPVRDYLAVLRHQQWTSSERFLVKRLEALERVIAA